MNEKVKAWAVIDKSDKPPRLFWGVKGNFHIYKTRKEAQAFIDEQFFEAKGMGWRVVPITLSKNTKQAEVS